MQSELIPLTEVLKLFGNVTIHKQKYVQFSWWIYWEFRDKDFKIKWNDMQIFIGFMEFFQFEFEFIRMGIIKSHHTNRLISQPGLLVFELFTSFSIENALEWRQLHVTLWFIISEWFKLNPFNVQSMKLMFNGWVSHEVIYNDFLSKMVLPSAWLLENPFSNANVNFKHFFLR